MTQMMKAIGYQKALPLLEEESLTDIELPIPEPRGHDVLVEVKAVAVNPVDTKIRANVEPGEDSWKVLGWDAAGIVKAVGESVSAFKPGDSVWYAGDLTRQGSNAEYQLVDERIAGCKPDSLDFASAAAMPLTAITAWEMLFDRLNIRSGQEHKGETLLIIGAAGGVGSVLVQLARKLTSLTVIATASRLESQAWLEQLGAHYVIDHKVSLSEQLRALGIGEVDHVVSLNHTEEHLDEIIASLKPQGQFGLIDDPETLNVRSLKSKSLSLHWEFMFTRSMYETEDMADQQKLLNEVAALIDQGVLKSTLGAHMGSISAANLRLAHEKLETGSTIGKIVLEGFE
ncbi:zinc-binding alcohol dehydrogenase family protein [Oceanimonas baumannii]|uniref:Zinc-type alcohol dehydrogenase-like protein n=2 Tax=Oceanimonas baumannii TaxID=129578 RepID=A0ABY2EY39_9GAMM|nr:zinc-binding alcohol dehydrogenase family protein [Oceanimonas baumannii]TDW58659.1 zinc-binding alcohol dehydrogenase family protein [Oceanimonas baumannii]